MKHYFIILLCLMTSNAQAQTLYKHIDSSGRITYSDKPPLTDTQRSKKIKANDDVSPERRSEAEQRTTRLREATIKPAKNPPPTTPQETQEQKLTQARAALKAAEEAMKQGREPLPDERIGLAGGGTRLTENYFERIKQLEEALAAAKKRVDELTSTENSQSLK